MKETKLNQVLAIEKGVKSRTQSTITQAYHKVQKATLLSGLFKTYNPLNEDSLHLPPERQRVQVRAGEILKDVRKALTELFDVTAQKDFANCDARADVVVGDKTLASNVPVTYLLFLEKQLTDFRTLVSKIPVLDSGEDWNLDEATGVFKSEPIKTTRTQKVHKPIVLYDATEDHPAQTQLVTMDEVVGHWTTTKQSGALPIHRKETLLEKIESVLSAVKFARETANGNEAPEHKVGAAIFGYLLD
jgi:hypothetical protein